MTHHTSIPPYGTDYSGANQFALWAVSNTGGKCKG
jgi:hypothetical protein